MQKRLMNVATGLVMVLMVMASVTHAEPLGKSGTGTIHSGWKAIGETIPIGENRSFWTGATWGVSFNDQGKGFLHNVAWHCPSINDIDNDMITTKGSCALTDTDGDKIYLDFTAKGPVGGEFVGRTKMSGGTGKYAGIQGGWDFNCWDAGPDGQLYCHQKYSYKLP